MERLINMHTIMIGNNFSSELINFYTKHYDDVMIFRSNAEYELWFLQTFNHGYILCKVDFVVFKSIDDMLNFKHYNDCYIHNFVLFEVLIDRQIPRFTIFNDINLIFDSCESTISLDLKHINNNICIYGRPLNMNKKYDYHYYSSLPHLNENSFIRVDVHAYGNKLELEYDSFDLMKKNLNIRYLIHFYIIILVKMI